MKVIQLLLIQGLIIATGTCWGLTVGSIESLVNVEHSSPDPQSLNLANQGEGSPAQ